jgi:hypothetical protein
VNPSSTHADREAILGLLRRVERRIRAHRLAHELTRAFCAALTIPIAFKVWDLFSPLSGVTVTTAIAVCLLAFGVFAMLRMFSRGNLLETAASVDEKANLYDTMTSASWFIQNDESSQWITAQIENASQNTANIDLPRLYPHQIPRSFYAAVALVILFIGLNFVPLSLNHNWLKLQAAPAGVPPQPVHQEKKAIEDALKQMAADLLQSEKTKSAGEALMEKELQRAADELRRLAKEMKEEHGDSPEELQEMQKSLERASQQSATELEKLSEALAEASQSMKNQNQDAAQQALENAAGELEKLERTMREGQSKDGKEQAKQSRPEAGQQQQGQNGQSRQASDEKSESESDGSGLDPSGAPPKQGDPNTLEVQLEQERLAGMPSAGSIPHEVHESSKQQTSRLEYSSVQSDLRAGKKDLMNRDAIPWEYRPLVKDYLQAIRPLN